MWVRSQLKLLTLVLCLAVFGYLVDNGDLGCILDEAWVDARVRSQGLGGVLLFLFFGTMFTAVGLPRQIVAFLAGYAFTNIWLSTLLGVLAALFGCMLTFYFARLLGNYLIHSQLNERASRFDRFIHSNPFTMTVLIRLLPVGSNLLTNLAAGISSIQPGYFFSGTILGYLPQTVVFALVGSGVRIPSSMKIEIGIVLMIISISLGLWLAKTYRRGNI